MLTVYTIEQSLEWDNIVRTFEKHDVYYLSGYVKAFQIHGDGEPLLFYYEDNDVRGINVVMKRDIAKAPHFSDRLSENAYFDFATPYGYGGWLIEGNATELLFEEYEEWCRQNGIVSEFVRFHPIVKNHLSCKARYEVVELGNTVALDLSSAENIWANITVKNRNMIRKAQKNGIRISNGRSPEIYEMFREIYNGTMDKVNAASYYYFEEEFYRSLLNDLPRNAEVFFAEYDGKPVAASVFLFANGKMYYHLSGSVREYAHLAPTNLLLYEAALWGCANGCDTLFLGGGVGSEEDSLFRFKRSFYRGDDLNRFYVGKKILNPLAYDRLVEMKNTDVSGNYFPQYRG